MYQNIVIKKERDCIFNIHAYTGVDKQPIIKITSSSSVPYSCTASAKNQAAQNYESHKKQSPVLANNFFPSNFFNDAKISKFQSFSSGISQADKMNND